MVAITRDERFPRPTIPDSVTIGTAQRAVAGMKAVRNLADPAHRYTLRQDGIQSRHPLLWRHAGAGAEVHYLPTGMYSRVSAPRAIYDGHLARDTQNSRFQGSLEGWPL